MNDEILTTLYATVGGIVLGGIVKLGLLAKLYIETLTTKAQQSIKEYERDHILHAVTRAATTAHSVIERTYVAPLKASNAWGAENAALAKERAVQLTLELLGDDMLAEVKRVINPKDVLAFISTYVEASK
jgi:hypothetical protein